MTDLKFGLGFFGFLKIIFIIWKRRFENFTYHIAYFSGLNDQYEMSIIRSTGQECATMRGNGKFEIPDESTERTPLEGTALADDLLGRCQKLLDELEAFRSFIEKSKESSPSSNAVHTMEIKHFHTTVLTEMKSLQKVREISKHCSYSNHSSVMMIFNS